MSVLDEIVEEWERDAKIDSLDIGSASLSTPVLHSKYLRLIVQWKQKKTKLELDMSQLRELKTRYYQGELSIEECREHGWEQWQYNKVLKANMDAKLQADKDVIAIQAKLDLVDTVIYALDAIITQIKSRDFQISNFIKNQVFMRGETF